jgi:hypothetical protein
MSVEAEDDLASSSSSEEDARPVYFRPFTRESLAAIKQRKAEQELKEKEIKAKRDEEVIFSNSFLNPFSRVTRFILVINFCCHGNLICTKINLSKEPAAAAEKY